ncbi:hypothetical protein ACFO6R_06255 [Eubacterium multiforme]|uniref:Uncharacterized protein n=1 Tax=Eubacterium multiforme TaxID=83339 RepID=A0ABT9USA9_9FIRM|nr:hypothetical protein [Eubacterium multiforme]MDQ0149194.1 hypothetical protein [Eubacterium multiforme]
MKSKSTKSININKLINIRKIDDIDISINKAIEFIEEAKVMLDELLKNKLTVLEIEKLKNIELKLNNSSIDFENLIDNL